MKIILLISILLNIYMTILVIYAARVLENDIKRIDEDHEKRLTLLNEYTNNWKYSFNEMNLRWKHAYEEMNNNWKDFYKKH